MKAKKLISGQSVLFRLMDAACPEFPETVRAIGSELQVTGNIVFLSDGCNRKDHFAVVEVAGIHAPLIVPVARLVSVTQPVEEPAWPTRPGATRKAC